MTPAISSRLARGWTRTGNTTEPSRETMSSGCPTPKAVPEPESADNRVITSPSALVLRWGLDLRFQLLCGAPRPVRIAQKLACQKHEVGLSDGENRVRLNRVGDHADGARQNVRPFADRL